MKKIFGLLVFTALMNVAFAQEENEDEMKGKFRKDNIFIGGGLNLGAGGGGFQLGITPEVGYSITKWLDAGVLFIINYQTQNNVYDQQGFGPYKIRNFNYGTGGFVRIWPVRFLHFSLQQEYNWTRSNQTFEPTGQKGTYTFKAPSLLAGIGYGSRQVGGSYQYLTLMIDLTQDIYSPYVDQSGDATPVIKAGFGFYLRPSRKR